MKECAKVACAPFIPHILCNAIVWHVTEQISVQDWMWSFDHEQNKCLYVCLCIMTVLRFAIPQCPSEQGEVTGAENCCWSAVPVNYAFICVYVIICTHPPTHTHRILVGVLCVLFIYTRMHARTHACTHARTHARTHAHTHTHTQHTCCLLCYSNVSEPSV